MKILSFTGDVKKCAVSFKTVCSSTIGFEAICSDCCSGSSADFAVDCFACSAVGCSAADSADYFVDYYSVCYSGFADFCFGLT